MNAIIYASLAIMIMGASHCKKNEPAPPEVKLYFGDSETQSICRQGDDGILGCVFTGSKEFDDFQAMRSDDVVKVLHYINELRSRCKSYD